jgi:hypothetical protein
MLSTQLLQRDFEIFPEPIERKALDLDSMGDG